MSVRQILLIDTCVLINLLASDEISQILQVAAKQSFICAIVKSESIYLRSTEPEEGLVAVDLQRRLPETRRYEAVHAIAPPINRLRLGQMATVAFFGNMFIAPASFFQNNYLKNVRHMNAARCLLSFSQSNSRESRRQDLIS